MCICIVELDIVELVGRLEIGQTMYRESDGQRYGVEVGVTALMILRMFTLDQMTVYDGVKLA